MKPEIEDLETFVDLNRTLNFTLTASRLRVERTVVTKRIKRLEESLGARLFERTTRRVRPTEEGKLLLNRAKGLVEGLVLIQDLFSKPVAPRGVVRMSAPVTVAHSLLSRVLPMVRSAYPDVQIELIATDRVLDFVEEGLDLTLRSSDPEDSSFVSHLLVKNELILAASPKYIKAFGKPKRVSDLAKHSLLFLDFHREIVFRKSKTSLEEFHERRGVICGDGRILNRLAEEGAGICIRPRWDLERSLSSRRLVEINLADELEDTTGLYLLYPKSVMLPHRTKVVIDAIQAFWKNSLGPG